MIRPGIMVSLKSTLRGGIEYKRTDLDASEEKSQIAADHIEKWQTVKVVQDAAESDRASKARGAARTAITKFCSNTAFGLLCPSERESELDEGIKQARKIVEEFNATSSTIQIGIFCLKGKVASSDVEAARAIGEEVRSLLAEMEKGIANLDAEGIREACKKAKAISDMLETEQQEKIGKAIELARKNARDIVRRIQKGGENAAIVLADLQRGAIINARMAFLDSAEVSETSTETQGEQMPAGNMQRFADLDE